MFSRALAIGLRTKKYTLSELITFCEKYSLTSLYPHILRELKLWEEKERLENVVDIETPFTLSDDALRALKKFIGAENLPHVEIIRPELLAGFRATYKGTRYERSAHSIIKEFTHTIH